MIRYSKILQSDKGSEYKNINNNIQHKFNTPQYTQTNGVVQISYTYSLKIIVLNLKKGLLILGTINNIYENGL